MGSKVRSIHIFLNDGEPEGLRSANIPLLKRRAINEPLTMQ